MRSTLFVGGLGLLAAHAVASPLLLQAGAPWRDPSPHQVRLITVESSVRLEVLDWGGLGPPVVLLGCYLTAHVYDEFAPKLANQFHVYGITRRGIGASDHPAGGYELQRSADDVLEVIDSLKLQKPILVANSCGGWVQTVLAAQHSDRLGGLVYLDAARSHADARRLQPATGRHGASAEVGRAAGGAGLQLVRGVSDRAAARSWRRFP